MQFQSLDWKDPLEKEMAIHSSIFVWGIPWTEEPGGLQSMGSQRGGHEEHTPCSGYRNYRATWLQMGIPVDLKSSRTRPVASALKP